MAVTADMLPAEVSRLESLGVRYVSIRRQQVLRIGRHLLSDVLEEHGIEVSCLGFAGGFTGAFGSAWDDVCADTLRAIDLAHSLGAHGVVVVPGTQGMHTYRHAERNIRDGLVGCASHARDSDVRIFVPTASVLPGQKDSFRPSSCPLRWVTDMACGHVHPMIVIRGRRNFLRLPRHWRYSLWNGGCLRLCPQTENYQENAMLLRRVVDLLCRNSWNRSST